AGDGSALYVAFGNPYACQSVAPSDLSLIGYLPNGAAYVNSVAVTSADKSICGFAGPYDAADLQVYSKAGALVGSYKFESYAHGLRAGQLVVSPDGFVAVAQGNDQILGFVPIGN
ncbi:MAG: hypothetical protein ABJD97_22480, partial [Betaproteobacteria bacterium]